MWLYVVGHEFTHVLWAWLCGGRVRSIKARAKGGHVILTKTNPLIALSPYFFPLYSVLWSLACGVARTGHYFNDLTPWFHFGLGITYAFHLTLTLHILRIRQPDIEGEGRFFSAVLIWLGNALILLLALPPLTGHGSSFAALALALERSGQVIAGVGKLARNLSP